MVIRSDVPEHMEQAKADPRGFARWVLDVMEIADDVEIDEVVSIDIVDGEASVELRVD